MSVQTAPAPTAPIEATVSHSPAALQALLERQRAFYLQGATLKLEFRLAQLRKLRDAVRKHDKALCQALYADLRKPEVEAYGAEVGFVLEEIQHTLKHLRSWMRPRTMLGPLTQAISTGAVYYKPYGVALIIAPWNYPVQLSLAPIIGALAAGNTVLLKPSELAPHTSAALARLLAETFPPEQVAVVEGGIETNQQLLALPVDYIFFTGSPQVGKIVMQAAAQRLTPLTLELGGKSPVFVDKDAHLDQTARRLVWGKFYNMGQTCIAPDYALVHRDIRPALVARMRHYIQQFYGAYPQQSPDLGRIINERHFLRLKSYLSQGEIWAGGETDAAERYIAPTLLGKVDPESPVMQEEIFGPILPILEYTDLREAIAHVQQQAPPLALYVFTRSKAYERQVLEQTTSGGGCVNDTLVHLTHPELPFGGVGSSGIGRYHGRESFLTFSHQRSILHRSTRIDPPIRYAPYTATKLRLLRSLIPSRF